MTTKIYEEPVFRIYGDQGVLMEFGSCISPAIHEQVRAMSIGLEQHLIKGVVECVASYRAVTIHYDPLVITFFKLKNELEKIYNGLEKITIPPPEIIEIPKSPCIAFVTKL